MKTLNELAILGGKPAFDQAVHVGKPNIPPKEAVLSKIEQALDKGWLTNSGPLVKEFETQLANYLGVKHCIAICNATRALEIATRALDIKGEVIVPSFTFIATAHSLQWQEVTPVFCDIDPLTHCLDPDKIEQHITPRTTAIMPVHLWGNACDTDKIEAIAQKHNLNVIYDASHAFACSHKGSKIGSFGDLEIFSFHATKILNTFEGGLISTNNNELATKIRLMKNFGFGGKDSVIHIGTNGKMSEASAAMGLASLQHLDTFININKNNYQHYQKYLSDISGLSLIKHHSGNYHYIALVLDAEKTNIRDSIINVLEKENVLARRYFYPGCHRMEPYASLYPNAQLLLPVTERICEQTICLPNGGSVDESAIETICHIIRLVIENPRKF